MVGSVVAIAAPGAVPVSGLHQQEAGYQWPGGPGANDRSMGGDSAHSDFVRHAWTHNDGAPVPAGRLALGQALARLELSDAYAPHVGPDLFFL